MLKVKIEVHTNSTDKNVKWHDLMTQEGIKNAYQHLDEIHENDNDYIISNVQTDWARFDSNTSFIVYLHSITIKIFSQFNIKKPMPFPTRAC